MSLSDFIRSHTEDIVAEWEEFVGTLPPGKLLTREQRRDSAAWLLEVIVREMRRSQGLDEPKQKSQGHFDSTASPRGAAREHARHRLEAGFDAIQLVAEFRALRASVLRLWLPKTENDAGDIIRFCEALDIVLTESLDRYTARLEESRDLFIAMLGHDLRSPLTAVQASAEILSKQIEAGKQPKLEASERIASSAQRMERMIHDLLDVAKSQLGGGIKLQLEAADVYHTVKSSINEAAMSHPSTKVEVALSGDAFGQFDTDRIHQMFGNLVENALHHGDGKPVRIVGEVKAGNAVIKLHNRGAAIPEDERRRLFRPFSVNDEEKGKRRSLGLGLHIAKMIAEDHGGILDLESSNEEGTTFTVVLPLTQAPAI